VIIAIIVLSVFLALALSVIWILYHLLKLNSDSYAFYKNRYDHVLNLAIQTHNLNSQLLGRTSSLATHSQPGEQSPNG